MTRMTCETGHDYAWNRYYSSTWGRFTSADPFQASGGPENPQSWNRYAYVENDPVNFLDNQGLERQGVWFYWNFPSMPKKGVDPMTFFFNIITGAPPILERDDPTREDAGIGVNPGNALDAIDEALYTAFDCLVEAVKDHFGLTVGFGALTVVGAPMYKGWLPPFRVIGPNVATSVLSSVGHFIQITVPRVASTANLLRAVGRISGPLGAALLAYDIAMITAGTWGCYAKNREGRL